MAELLHTSGLTFTCYEIVTHALKVAQKRILKGDPLSESARTYGPFGPSAYLLELSHGRANKSDELTRSVDVLSAWAIREALRDLQSDEAYGIIHQGLRFRKAFGFSPRLFPKPTQP